MEFALFSKPYYQELMVLYVKGDDKSDYRVSPLLELFTNHDFKLGMIKGAKFDSLLTAIQTGPQFKTHFIYANTSNRLSEMLSSGVIDGYFSGPLIMDSLITDSTKNILIESYHLKIKTGSLHFMFSKKRTNSARLPKFNKAFIKILETNSSKIDWFLQDKKA